MMLSKETFIQTIDFIRERNDKQHEIDMLFRKEFEDSIFWPYSKYEVQLVKVLKEIMNDKETEWIDYYLWEKDYGRDNKLEVTEKDGTPIPLTTAEDLWNLLQDNLNHE